MDRSQNWKRRDADSRPRRERAQGRAKLKGADRTGISSRLRRFYRVIRGYASIAEFGVKSGLPDSTLKGWLGKNNSRAPDVASLLTLAWKEGVSLNWLLLGEGPEFFAATVTRRELTGELRGAVVLRIARDLALTPEYVTANLPSGAAMLREFESLYVERIRSLRAQRRADTERRKATLLEVAEGRHTRAVMVAARRVLSNEPNALDELRELIEPAIPGEPTASAIADDEHATRELVSREVDVALRAAKTPTRRRRAAH